MGLTAAAGSYRYLSMADATITDIHDSSDLVWELLCQAEDGIEISDEQIEALSEGDWRIFSEEMSHMTRKARRAAVDKARLAHWEAEDKARFEAECAEAALMPWEHPNWNARVERARAFHA